MLLLISMLTALGSECCCMNSPKTSGDAMAALVWILAGALGFGVWQESMGAGVFIFVIFSFAPDKLYDWKE